MAATPQSTLTSLGLLVLRLGPSLLMFLLHGGPKVAAYSEKASQFGDPIGLGPTLSYTLVAFAEAACALAVAVGLLTRFAAIPLMITMAVAVLVAHAADPLARKELPILFFCVYTTLLFTGAGRYSIDHWLRARAPERLRAWL